jgi:hypothetical protein
MTRVRITSRVFRPEITLVCPVSFTDALKFISAFLLSDCAAAFFAI